MPVFNLITRPKRKGYFVLRIDNFNFKQPDPLKIWDVVFYNPQINLKLNYQGMKRHKEDIENIERYFEQHLTAAKKRKLRSTCNVIVATEYRPQYFNHIDPSIFKVIEKIEHSLLVLKHLKRMHVGGYAYSTSLSLTSVIVADQQINALRFILIQTGKASSNSSFGLSKYTRGNLIIPLVVMSLLTYIC